MNFIYNEKTRHINCTCEKCGSTFNIAYMDVYGDEEDSNYILKCRDCDNFSGSNGLIPVYDEKGNFLSTLDIKEEVI